MLSLLHIEHIAVIESADIQFEAGFNALTGETGAGKSIVVDAIGTVIGGRTSRELIRTGARSALVSAVFSQLPELPWFAENEMWPDEEGNLLIQREIMADGKNVCRMGGRPITLSQLRTLGQQLLNIHGQHDGQQLLDPACHLSYLDRFAGTLPEAEKFAETYDAAESVRKQIKALHMDEAEKSRRIDTLNYQIGELERAELCSGEDEQLTARRDMLRNAGKLIGAVEEAHRALSGDEDMDGAVSLLMDAERSLSSASGFSGEIAELAERTSQLRYTADDMAQQVRELRSNFDFEPDELDRVESRLDVIYRLKKKYGDSVEDMLTYLERCRNELDEIQAADNTTSQLEETYKNRLREATCKGKLLTEKRKQGAVALEERIQRELSQLDMPKVQFQVEFQPKAGENGMDATGMDEVQFLMSANVGEALKPIQKIASGGELARIMLALKNVLAENDDVTTLVFDEVDTGVSGRAAQKVAEKMADVARRKQVLCVTHLPQIAAMADAQFSVEKGEKEGRTFTSVARLDEEERCKELARLTGGVRPTAAMLKSAGELLAAAAVYKRGRS
ncbi:MAG: DNA repair protein RecN [Intestinimonas sp.]|jgi:DNA repair protein RecN (Recombination protein N)|nr:DNA repair protein RecN [Intestinimonas sp.]